jgi:hypothetical protein
MTDPVPSFFRTRSMLLMEEIQQANAAATAASTALVTQTCPAAPPCTGSSCCGDSTNSSCPRKQKAKRGGRLGTTLSLAPTS